MKLFEILVLILLSLILIILIVDNILVGIYIPVLVDIINKKINEITIVLNNTLVSICHI